VRSGTAPAHLRRALRCRGRARVEHGRDQHQPGQRRRGAVASHERDGRGQVAARFLARQEELRLRAGDARALRVQPFERCVPGLHRIGKAVRGRERIADRGHHGAGVGQQLGEALAALQAAAGEGTAVQVQDQAPRGRVAIALHAQGMAGWPGRARVSGQAAERRMLDRMTVNIGTWFVRINRTPASSLFPLREQCALPQGEEDMDQIQSMRVFARVVETGSFTKAAESLEMPKGSATKLVQQLETRLKVKLLNRTTRRVTVTPDGAAYYERASRLLNDLDDMESAMTLAQGKPGGRLRVDVGSSVAVADHHPGAAGVLPPLSGHPARPGRGRPAGGPDQRQRGLRDPRRRAHGAVAGGAQDRQHAAGGRWPRRRTWRNTERPGIRRNWKRGTR
jgi:molybdenum-dependent DNA-binding transcriptional regulator ModE